MKPYVYIVVRKDIKPENYAPQIAHAALESGYQSEEPDETTHIVVLQVDDKIELEMVAQGLWQEEVPFEEFHEGFANMGLTALATLPMEKPAIGWLKNLKLFNYD
jgi:hypothetical protein